MYQYQKSNHYTSPCNNSLPKKLGSYRVANYHSQKIPEPLKSHISRNRSLHNQQQTISISINFRPQTLHLTLTQLRIQDYFLIRTQQLSNEHQRYLQNAINQNMFNGRLLTQESTANLRMMMFSEEGQTDLSEIWKELEKVATKKKVNENGGDQSRQISYLEYRREQSAKNSNGNDCQSNGMNNNPFYNSKQVQNSQNSFNKSQGMRDLQIKSSESAQNIPHSSNIFNNFSQNSSKIPNIQSFHQPVTHYSQNNHQVPINQYHHQKISNFHPHSQSNNTYITIQNIHPNPPSSHQIPPSTIDTHAPNQQTLYKKVIQMMDTFLTTYKNQQLHAPITGTLQSQTKQNCFSDWWRVSEQQNYDNFSEKQSDILSVRYQKPWKFQVYPSPIKSPMKICYFYKIMVRWEQSPHEDSLIQGSLDLPSFDEVTLQELKQFLKQHILNSHPFFKPDCIIQIQQNKSQILSNDTKILKIRGTLSQRKINLPKSYAYFPVQFDGFTLKNFKVLNKYGQISFPQNINIEGIDFSNRQKSLSIQLRQIQIHQQKLRAGHPIITLNSIPKKVLKLKEVHKQLAYECLKEMIQEQNGSELKNIDYENDQFTFQLKNYSIKE